MVAKSNPGSYISGMVIQSIRQFTRALPFKPFEIWTTGGERYSVRHPDFICISAEDYFVIVIDKKERPHQLDSSLIEGVSPLKGLLRRKKRKTS